MKAAKYVSLLKLALSIGLTAILPQTSIASQLKEGVHYEVIGKKSTSTPEIAAYFSFYCNHCYAHEPLSKLLRGSQAAHGYKFRKMHVDFLKMATEEQQLRLAKTLVIAERKDKPEIVEHMFRAIHADKNKLREMEQLVEIVEQHGISENEYANLLDSFSVITEARIMKTEQIRLMREGHLRGVPTFIVNNRYRLIPDGFKVSSYEAYFKAAHLALIELSKR